MRGGAGPRLAAGRTTAGPEAWAAPREHAAPRTAALHRIAWMDVAIQLVVGALILALGWAVVTGGVFQRAVDGFTTWYVGDVAPIMATGIAVIPAQEFRSGFFADRPEVPAMLERPGPGYLTVSEITELASPAGAS